MPRTNANSYPGPLATMGFASGDFACGLIWNTTVMFLMFYYTDVFGLSAAAAGTMLLVARVIDGFGDLSIGLAVDRTNTRWGRCRPYLLFGAPLIALMAIACFTVPDLPPTGKILYAGVTYTGLMLAYSLVNIPYSSLPILMTADSDKRTRMAVVRMAFATAGWMVVGGLTLPLVGALGHGNPARGYFSTMLVFSLCALAVLWLCFATTRETVAPERARRNIGGDVLAVLGSRAWWSLALALAVTFIGLLMPAGCTIYYFTYVVRHPQYIPAFFVIGNVGNLAGVWLTDRLTRRWCKRTLLRWILVPTALVPLLFQVVDAQQLWQVFVLGFLINGLPMMTLPIYLSMVADTADGIELSTQKRVVGLSGSAITLAVKFGSGLSGALTGLVLSTAGYVAGAAQSPRAIDAIVTCMSVGPFAAYAIVLAIMQLYPYGRKEVDLLQSRLALQRAGAR